ncbi:Exocyst complex component 8, partial [Bienertia sinuspersici]
GVILEANFGVSEVFRCCCHHFPLLCKVDEMIDEAMKEDVFLPRLWRMFYEYPSLLDSGRRVEVVDDVSLVRMFAELVYEDEVKVFTKEVASVGTSFRFVVERGKKGGRRVTTRVRKSIQPQEAPSEDDESPWGSDSSEDDDYVQSDVTDEEDLEDLDLVDEFGDEDDVDAPITSKSFEDYLDGSSCFNQLYKNGTVVGEIEFGEVKLKRWMIFSNKEHFLGTFRDYCIQEGFAVRVEKADNVRLITTGIVQDCEWRIHASKLMDEVSWAIKSIIGEHKLFGRLKENPTVSSAWLIRHLREDITATPDIPMESLQTLCMKWFRVKVKKRLLYKVRTNPGSYALITWTGTSEDDGPRFKGCFFSFAAEVRGFLKGCRPIIGFDGAYISGYYKGNQLTAVGIDGNNEISPIAYGIVDNERIESWSYFFRNLRLLFRGEGVE